MAEYVKRRLTFGDVADRLLIAAVGLILLFVGKKMDKMSDQIEALLQTVTATVTKQEASEKRVDRIERDMDEHFREDRDRFHVLAPGRTPR